MSNTQMQSTLYNDPGVQATVDTFTQSSTTYYMIFDSILIPDELVDDSGNINPTVQNKTINHFDVTPSNGLYKLQDRTRQVSCRAYTQADAEAIREACFQALNKVRSNDGNAYFACSFDPVLPPSDKTDNYNAPLSVRTLNLKN